MREPTCESCRFWYPMAESGQCRRKAPAPLMEFRLLDADENLRPRDAWWPLVMADDWCGEYEPKAAENLQPSDY